MAGTFDPVTIGHFDIIKRASELFDNVIVGVFENSAKQPLFSADVRLSAVIAAVKSLPNVTAVRGDGMLAEFAKNHGACAIVKGIRNASDAMYEHDLANINRRISGIETVLLPAKPEYSYITSTMVREFIKYKKPYKDLVPDGVFEILK